MVRQMDRQTGRQLDGWTGKWTNKWTNLLFPPPFKMDRQMDKQTDRHLTTFITVNRQTPLLSTSNQTDRQWTDMLDNFYKTRSFLSLVVLRMLPCHLECLKLGGLQVEYYSLSLNDVPVVVSLSSRGTSSEHTMSYNVTLSVCLSVCLSVRASVCPSMCMCLSVYLCVCQSLPLFHLVVRSADS